MTEPHDPLRQVNYLQQCLSNDKKPLGLFLGAGCPVSIKSADGSSPLIPDIAGITEEVRTRLGNREDCAPLLELVEGHFTADERTDTNLEDMLSHIRALRLVAGKEKVRGLTADDLDRLDKEICGIVHELAAKSLPDTASPYHHSALWTDAVGREYPVEVFTTNYDLLLESALEDCRVPYFDGFTGVLHPFFDIRAMEEDKLPPRWARVWKLHGSINWYYDLERGVLRGAPNETGLKRVIHPSNLKYEESRRMPYLAMMDRLRAFLKQPSSVLVISGYSFRDEHINEVIVQGLQATQTAIVFALLFDELETYPNAVKLALQRTNLTLIAPDGGVVGGQIAKWMEKGPDLETDGSSSWVSWVTVDPSDPNSRLKAVSNLGDFAVLGSFLHTLIGHIRGAQEAPNGK